MKESELTSEQKKQIDLALKMTTELWDWLEESGSENKKDWPGWDNYADVMDKNTVPYSCPLCEMTRRIVGSDGTPQISRCSICPYNRCYGFCNNPATPYTRWTMAFSDDDRKFYAGMFLEQLVAIRSGDATLAYSLRTGEAEYLRR